MKINFKLFAAVLFIVISSCKNEAKLSAKQSSDISTIRFSTQSFLETAAKDLEYTTQLHMPDDKNLNIQFELAEPLIKSLQKLEPTWSQDELLKNGNFQFVIYVDEVLAYTQNLQSGAGTVESKTKQFRHRIPLMHPERIDYWGWYLWLRFMKMSGGQDMLSEGEHQLKIEIRPYMQSSELKVGDLLAQGELKVQVAEIPVDKNKVSIQSIARNSGWAVSKSDYNKAKIESLNKKIISN